MNTSYQGDQEDLIQALFEGATECMLIATEEGDILAFNSASCQETGYHHDTLQELMLDKLFPKERPTPILPFKPYQLRHRDGYFITRTVETRPMANGRFLIICHHPTKQNKAKQKISQLTETIKTINGLAIKLNGLLTSQDPFKQIAKIIHEIPDVFGVTVSTFHPETSELIVRELATPATESGILSRINQLIGRSLIGMHIPVEPEVHQRILKEQVATVGDLHSVTFGEIPKPISTLFHRTFKIENLYGLALSENEELLGTVVIAMRRNAEPLTPEIRMMLGTICAITLRRTRYEQELQASEAKFRSYIEHAPLGIFVVDRNGRYRETNPTAEQMLGYTKNEFKTLTIQNILHPNFAKAGFAHFQQVVETGNASGEFCLRTKDGSTLWTVIEAAKLSDNTFIAFTQDITARKEAEQNSKLKDELLHLTGEMGHIGGWEFNAETLEGTWTDEVAKIHELDPQQTTNVALGKSFYPEDGFKKIESAIENVIQHGQPYDLELPFIGAKGTHKWVRTMGLPIYQDGKVVKVRGIFQDITKSKQAEETLKEQVLLQKQLSQIAETVPGMICSFQLEKEGRTSMPYTSPALTDIYGLSAAALAQDATPLFARFHQDDLAWVQQTIEESARTMEPWHAEYRYHHPQKGERWIEGHSRPQEQPDGSILWHGFIQDITEKKHAEQAQIQLEAQLRQVQKMDSIGRLAGGIAHDFNNLLTVIQMYADLMYAKMDKEDPLRPKLVQIRRASERASDLTRQLLAFSRKQIMTTAVINLNEQIRNLHKMFARLIGEDINLSIALAPDPWPIKADPGQIEQVIMNLVVNARDAMPTGGMLTIETHNIDLKDSFLTSQIRTPAGPCVLLAISDTGHGMDEATRQHIFEPFFTTKDSGSGTGLGLATVHGIVRQSGGNIFVYSELGHGTTFKIYLPASQEEAEAPTPEPTPEPLNNRGDETILVVEDEAAVRNLVCSALEEYGYTILAAKDGYAALSLMEKREEPIDLLLTDVVMPRMSGRELAEQLMEQWPGLKVLFMSGYMDDAVVRHGILTAQVAFLPKPFSRNALASKVREVLDE